MKNAAIIRGNKLIGETQTQVIRQRAEAAALRHKVDGLVELLNAFDKVGGVLDNAPSRVTLPVEAADADKIVLRTETIHSESRYGKTYEVTVELFKGNLGTRNLVLNCSCEAFRFTRGEVRNGTKEHCKHIRAFRREHPTWAYTEVRKCRSQGIAIGETIGRKP